METKYNLNITTSGENGDNATTSISTTDANKLAELLNLAGMSQSHPVALNVSPEEEYDAPCPDCGDSPCGCGMTEGESWDNEPEATVHSPEEVFKVGDDLHRVKKSYPPVAGGDNPMALESAENKLRNAYDEFIAESEEEAEEVEEAIRVKYRTKKEVPHRARKPLEKEEVEEEVEEVHETPAGWAKSKEIDNMEFPTKGVKPGWKEDAIKAAIKVVHDMAGDYDGAWAAIKDAYGEDVLNDDAVQDALYKANVEEDVNRIRQLAGLDEAAGKRKKPEEAKKAPEKKDDGKGKTWGVVA